MYYEERGTWWALWSKRVLLVWGLIDIINNLFGTSVGSMINRILIRIFPVLITTFSAILISFFLLPDIPISPKTKVAKFIAVDVATFENAMQYEEHRSEIVQAMKPKQVGQEEKVSSSESSEQPSLEPHQNTLHHLTSDDFLLPGPSNRVGNPKQTGQNSASVSNDQNTSKKDIESPLEFGPPSKRTISARGYEKKTTALATEKEPDINIAPEVTKKSRRKPFSPATASGRFSGDSSGKATDTLLPLAPPAPQSGSKSKSTDLELTKIPREGLHSGGSTLSSDQLIPFTKTWLEKYLSGLLPYLENAFKTLEHLRQINKYPDPKNLRLVDLPADINQRIGILVNLDAKSYLVVFNPSSTSNYVSIGPQQLVPPKDTDRVLLFEAITKRICSVLDIRTP